MPILTERAAGKLVGVSGPAVHKAIVSQRIRPLGEYATEAEFVRDWDAQAEPRLAKRTAAKAEAETYAESRARHEKAKADERELKLQVMREELIQRERANRLTFELAKRARESWEQWPARVAAEMAAELGVEPHTIQAVLTRRVKEHLLSMQVRPVDLAH